MPGELAVSRALHIKRSLGRGRASLGGIVARMFTPAGGRAAAINYTAIVPIDRRTIRRAGERLTALRASAAHTAVADWLSCEVADLKCLRWCERQETMQRLLCAVSGIVLFLPGVAAAQQPAHKGGSSHQAQQSRPNKPPSTRPSGQRTQPSRPNRPVATRPSGQHAQPSRPNRPVATRPSGQHAQPSRPNRPVATRPQPQHATRPSVQSQTFRIGARPSTFHRYRAPRFSYPRGWGYRRWQTGGILPRIFLSNSYYWSNWSALGLGSPPPGYVWVRYGPDLLLVNRRTGRIADAIYGAFY